MASTEQIIGASILATGFMPFQSFRSNPSSRIASALDGRMIAGMPVTSVVLPVEYAACERFVRDHFDSHRYPIVVLMGLNARSRRIALERLAVNLEHAVIADEADDCATTRTIDPRGPDGIFSNWPVDRLHARLASEGFPVTVSNSAGTYVCNALFYRVLRRMSGCEQRDSKVGFVHLPRISRRIPSDRMMTAIERLIELLAAEQGDSRNE